MEAPQCPGLLAGRQGFANSHSINLRDLRVPSMRQTACCTAEGITRLAYTCQELSSGSDAPIAMALGVPLHSQWTHGKALLWGSSSPTHQAGQRQTS